MPRLNIDEKIRRIASQPKKKSDADTEYLELEGSYNDIKEELPEKIKNLVNNMKEKCPFLSVFIF